MGCDALALATLTLLANINKIYYGNKNNLIGCSTLAHEHMKTTYNMMSLAMIMNMTVPQYRKVRLSEMALRCLQRFLTVE